MNDRRPWRMRHANRLVVQAAKVEHGDLMSAISRLTADGWRSGHIDGDLCSSTFLLASTEKIAHFLLKSGANLTARDQDGWTALHHAAYGGRKDVVSLILEYGLDVNVKNKIGETALHLAASRNVAELLLINGANIDVQALAGHTLLHDAAGRKRKRLVSLLLQYGANEDLLTESGRKASDYSDTICDYIIQCKAELNRMRNHKLEKNLSLYDVLQTQNPLYLLNDSLLDVIKRISLKEEFPIYMFAIKAKLKKDKQKMELLPQSADCLDKLLKASSVLTGVNLPYELRLKILSHLRPKHHENFKLCIDSIENQLSQHNMEEVSTQKISTQKGQLDSGEFQSKKLKVK